MLLPVWTCSLGSFLACYSLDFEKDPASAYAQGKAEKEGPYAQKIGLLQDAKLH